MTDAFGKRGQKKIASVVENVLPDYATVVSSSSMLPYFYNQVTCVASAERGGKGAEYSQARDASAEREAVGGGGSRILAREYFFPFRSPFCACHTRYISGNFNNLVT